MPNHSKPPVSSGGPEEEGLERERAQFLAGGGGVRRDDAQREAVPEERELLEAEGAAGDGAVGRGGVAGDVPGVAVEGLRGGDVEVPEGGVHGRPQVRHFGASAALSLVLVLLLSSPYLRATGMFFCF